MFGTSNIYDFIHTHTHTQHSPGGTSGKEPACQSRLGITDIGLIPGSGRSPGGGHGNPFQYSYMENPIDRGVWQAAVHRVTKSWT